MVDRNTPDSVAGVSTTAPRRPLRRGVRARMREDFELAVILSIGSIAVVVVAAFAVFRFSTGNVAGGVLNCAIVVALVSVMVYAAGRAPIRRAGAFFAALSGLACVASVLMFGRTGLFWGFLVIWINFAVAPRWLALIVNLGVIACVMAMPGLFEAGTEQVAYLVTAMMATACAWVVAARFDQQRRQLRLLANEDPLTGAANRRQLSADLDALTEPGRARSGGVLAVLDLDHFKRVNDDHGHEAGDAVLVAVVELLSAQLRQVDGLYRLGGEEFVLLLPGARLSDAAERLQALKQVLNQGLASLPGAVTVSIGAAELDPAEDPRHWLARADAALYAAKQGGRNRVELAARSHSDSAAIKPAPTSTMPR